MKYKILLLLLCFIASNTIAQKSNKTLSIQDIMSLDKITAIQVSPDEQWIAYTLRSVDTIKDESRTQLFMVSSDGKENLAMTSKEYSASRPRWSPDGKYLSFLAKKGKNAKTQVWSLNRVGGEAQQITNTKQGVNSYEWSPNADRLVLILRDPKASDLTKDIKDDKKPLPHVIDRLHFKKDYVGYLDNRRSHLYSFTLGDTTNVQLTFGDYDDSDPKWSPDGKSIVFVSNRSAVPDLSYDSNIWMVSADNKKNKGTLKQITTNPFDDDSPNWSPDGKSICYRTVLDNNSIPFSTSHLATISIAGGSANVLTKALDRFISDPSFTKDGKRILFTVGDQGEEQLASISTDGKSIERLVHKELTCNDYAVGKSAIYSLHGYSDKPANIFKLKDEKLQQITEINKKQLAGIEIPKYEKVNFKSKDGTPVEGFVVKPPNFDKSKKYPLILWIHGGPTSQFTYNFERIEPSFLASNGYVVLLVNPRGSTGYGDAFCKAIFADWGNKDYEDVMAGVDHLIGQGFIDENKLGVGGWSYGGILTNYVITKNTRFKAAISGASLGLYRANFGHDEYVKWYKAEWGFPWDNKELWERLSPFNDIEKITTPTLWIGGALDWNVPIINSEQMYLGMKSLGKETQLVVYPGEHHGIRRPSFQKDRLERYINWFDKYLK